MSRLMAGEFIDGSLTESYIQVDFERDKEYNVVSGSGEVLKLLQPGDILRIEDLLVKIILMPV